jgi:hypothetical protein
MDIDTYINIVSDSRYTLGGIRYLINGTDPDIEWGRPWKESLRSEYEYWVKRHGVASLPDVHIAIRPIGFWSDVITLRTRARYGCPTEVDLSWSTGGIDPKEEFDISRSAMHFSCALTAAAQTRSSMLFRIRAAEQAAKQTTEV